MASRPRLALAALLLAVPAAMLFVPAPFAELDGLLLKGHFRIRGESPPDSSAILVSLDNDDIAALGGLPLKRSYYALLIRALHEMGAAAIGLDIAFTETNLDHPEYDNLLAGTVRRAGPVVLGSYFRTLYAAVSDGTDPAWPSGGRFDPPYPALRAAATSVGHTNIGSDGRIPLHVRTADSILVPAFGLALLDAGGGRPRAAIPTGPDLAIDFPGGAGSIATVRAVEVLKAYDRSGSGLPPGPLPGLIRGRYVIVAIIAEGRSTFLDSPFTNRFPSSGIHAAFVINALRNQFLTTAPPLAASALALAVGLLSIWALAWKRPLTGLIAIPAFLVSLFAVGHALFVELSFHLPLAGAILTTVVAGTMSLLIRDRKASGVIRALASERDAVVGRLAEQEAILRSLEEELDRVRARASGGESSPLEAEVVRYREEVSRLRELERDLLPAASATAEAPDSEALFHGLAYAAGSPMAAVVALTRKVAPHDATVLLQGESGTGKELIARALHNLSPRSGRPLVAVNCGALAEGLLESELFGHERGAFTGAAKDNPGRFEAADGGTIFLDEIGEITEAFQVKLLRVLQDGTYQRVGGNQTRKADVRVIAATNRDLRAAVASRKFREDLYYRLNVFPIHIPPLRERPDDIPILVRRILATEGDGMAASGAAMDALRRHAWRGNVRELQSVLRRGMLMANSEGRNLLRLNDLPPELRNEARPSGYLDQKILESLRLRGFSHHAIMETAEELGGLNRGTVAEYYRGFCFQYYVEEGFDIGRAARRLAGTDDPGPNRKVGKKMRDYVEHAIREVSGGQSTEEALRASKAKFKNLPHRYHAFLESIITETLRRKSSLT